MKLPWSPPVVGPQASLVSLQGQPTRFVEHKDRDLARKAKEKAGARGVGESKPNGPLDWYAKSYLS